MRKSRLHFDIYQSIVRFQTEFLSKYNVALSRPQTIIISQKDLSEPSLYALRLISMNKKLYAPSKNYVVWYYSNIKLIVALYFKKKSKNKVTLSTLPAWGWLTYASEQNYFLFVKFLLQLQSANYRHIDYCAFYSALSGGHYRICRFLLENYNVGLKCRYAAESGHLDLCRKMIQLGATDIREALFKAVRSNFYDTCKYLLSVQPLDPNIQLELLRYTHQYGHKELYNLILSYPKGHHQSSEQ